MEYEIISVTQFQALLAEAKGAKIITLTTLTTPDVKKDCPYKDVVKISVVNGIVNWHYSYAVNRQREREGKEKDFEPSPRKWGTRLKGLPFVSHVRKDGEHKLYLEVKVERILSIEYKDSEGKLIDNKELEPFLKEKKNSKGLQGLEKEIICRDYSIESIVTINIQGQGYILRR